jgi:hypothetical protein
VDSAAYKRIQADCERGLTMARGGRRVVINFDGRTYSARLYVNVGETATLVTRKARKQSRIIEWANKQLGYSL